MFNNNSDEENKEVDVVVPHNRCFTYPQGDRPVLPQVLTLMAVFSSIFTFPIIWDHYFMCVETDGGWWGIDQYTTLPSGNETVFCFSLCLNRQEYWGLEEAEGWAAMIQVSTVFAIVSTALGFITFCQLATAVCFALQPRRLLIISIMLGFSALFQISTLAAGAVDVCTLWQIGGYQSCTTTSMRLESGAGFAIFAFIFYLMAFITTLMFFFDIKNEALSKERRSKEIRARRHDSQKSTALGEKAFKDTTKREQDEEEEADIDMI